MMRDVTSVAAVILFGIAVNALVSQAASADSPRGGALSEEADLEQIPTVWRNLANESMMYPMEMGDVAAKIGPERQLFVDNCLLAKATGVTREVHQPVRYERNPVLTPNRGGLFSEGYLWMVRQFDESPRFRIWYQASDQWHDNPIGKKLRFMIGYATSENGMNWVKPNVGIFEIEGSKKNHIVIHEGSMHGLFYEPWDPDPQKRFKAFVCVEGWKQIVPEGYYLYTSPDGIHWKGDLSQKIIQSSRGYTFPLNGAGDTSRFWWDPICKKYRGDIKFILPGKIRVRGSMESEDLIHWSRAQPTFYALEEDKQIYHHIPFVYQGMYLGFRWIFHPEYVARTGPEKFPGHVMHAELDCSRDGCRWTRVGTGQPLMALNHKRDTWDCLMLKPVEPLIVGDEIWIYYTSLNMMADPATPAYPAEKYLRNNCVGLARLRLDGFVSLNADEDPGIVRTRPLGFAGKTLHVNAEVAEGGEVRAALVSRDGGQYVEGYTADDCTPVTGDGIDKVVSWKGGSDISDLSNSGARIEFTLRKAKLYSFWVE